MLEKSFGMLFFLKQPKHVQSEERYIYLRITVDGHGVEWSTKHKWDENRWDQDKGRASGVKEDARLINSYLDELTDKVRRVRKTFLEQDEQITAEDIRDRMLGINTQKMILQLFAEHNKRMEALVGKQDGFAKGTFERYETSLDHTRKFIEWQYQKEDMDIRKLNHAFIEQYGFWLRTVRGCNHNSTVKYLANFKKIVLYCVKNRWLPADPFVNYKLIKKDIERDPLTQWELDKIMEKDFGSDRMNNVRDIFVFGCYTGLAYADVKKLTRSEIIKSVDGEQWIITSRQKTDTPCPIPLLPISLNILNKYADHPKCVNGNLALPVLSNQKMNGYLKEVADRCTINKVLTFHLARHTFATTVTLANGVPMETVSKMLGHTNLRQTQHYAKVMHGKIGLDMAALRSKRHRPRRSRLPPYTRSTSRNPGNRSPQLRPDQTGRSGFDCFRNGCNAPRSLPDALGYP